MIEGMVMELYKDHVIVMTKSGEFLKLRKRGNVNIGDIYKENIYRRIPVLTCAAAAVLIFVFTSLAGYTAYANQIVGYVDIKGNKDVRLYVSRKGTVEKVDGVQNPDQIKNLPVYQAVEELNTIASVEGIYNNSSEVEISTTEVKDSKLDFNKVNENVKKILTKDNEYHGKNKDNKFEKGNKDKSNEIQGNIIKQNSDSKNQIDNENNGKKDKVKDSQDKGNGNNKHKNKNNGNIENGNGKINDYDDKVKDNDNNGNDNNKYKDNNNDNK